MERRISRNYHPALNYDFARTRNVLNLRGEPSGHHQHHNNHQQQLPGSKTSQIVFEFDSSRSNRFNYLVDQLKRQSSPVERLAVMQSLMNEFIDDINIREHDDSDTSIATDQSAQEYFQNICQLNFAEENPDLANLSNMNSFPPGSRFNGLAGSYIHKPQAIRKPSSRPASITMPSLSAITQPVVQQPVQRSSQSVTKGKKSQPFKPNPGSSFQNYNHMHVGQQMSQQQQQQQNGLPQLQFDPAVEYLSEEDLLKRQNTKERNQKYRERKQVEDPHDYRKRKSEAQKRYLERQKMADPDGYRRKKAEQQKRYMEKKAKDDPKLFFANMRF